MHRREAELVLIAGRHPVVEHKADGLQMAALGGQMQRGVFVEAVLRRGDESLVDLEHGLEDLDGPLLGGHVGQGVPVPAGMPKSTNYYFVKRYICATITHRFRKKNFFKRTPSTSLAVSILRSS